MFDFLFDWKTVPLYKVSQLLTLAYSKDISDRVGDLGSLDLRKQYSYSNVISNVQKCGGGAAFMSKY